MNYYIYTNIMAGDVKNIISEDTKSAKDYLMFMLKESHLELLFAFVILYAFVSLGYSSLAKHSNNKLSISLTRLFDYVFLVVVLAFGVYYYFTVDNYTKTHLLDVIMKESYKFYEYPVMMFSTMIFICVFTLITFALSIPTHGENTPLSVTIIAHKGWYLLYSQVIFNMLKFGLGMDLVRYLKDPKNYYNGEPKKEDAKNEKDGADKPAEKEVFHINNNLYTYRDAKDICKSLDSRLATYEEIEGAYKKGGEWCSYGWSDSQMAFFPTQTATWKGLQKNPKTKNMCGRPGINGGFIKNPATKYGVNCFGVKPDESLKSKGIAPNSKEFLAQFEKTRKPFVNAWKKKRKQLSVQSFNPTKWSSSSS